MLPRDTFTQNYIDDCRTHLRRKVTAFQAVRLGAAEASATDLSTDLAELEPRFFNALITTLETMFMHRPRSLEGTTPNALHELRLLATSIREHHAVLTLERDSAYNAGQSMLGLEPGDAIAVSPDGFERLMDAFFAQLSARLLGESWRDAAA